MLIPTVTSQNAVAPIKSMSLGFSDINIGNCTVINNVIAVVKQKTAYNSIIIVQC